MDFILSQNKNCQTRLTNEKNILETTNNHMQVPNTYLKFVEELWASVLLTLCCSTNLMNQRGEHCKVTHEYQLNV